jgi:hypothetical protein
MAFLKQLTSNDTNKTTTVNKVDTGYRRKAKFGMIQQSISKMNIKPGPDPALGNNLRMSHDRYKMLEKKIT